MQRHTNKTKKFCKEERNKREKSWQRMKKKKWRIRQIWINIHLPFFALAFKRERKKIYTEYISYT